MLLVTGTFFLLMQDMLDIRNVYIHSKKQGLGHCIGENLGPNNCQKIRTLTWHRFGDYNVFCAIVIFYVWDH